MLVTINTDASFYYKNNLPFLDRNVGGYAFWITCNVGRFKKWGYLKTTPYDSHAAEMMCIINALHFVHNHKEIWGISKVIVNTDSDYSIKCFTEKYRKPKQFRNLKIKFNDYRTKNKYPIEFRAIKAHNTEDNSARSYVNDWVDKHAKKGARLMLKQIENG